MELNQLKDYLKAVISLESAVLTCKLGSDRVRQEINHLENPKYKYKYVDDSVISIKLDKPKPYNMPPQPKKKEATCPQQPEATVSLFSWSRLLVSFVVLLVVGNMAPHDAIGLIAMILVYVIWSCIATKEKRNEDKIQYRRKMEEYQWVQNNLEQKYQNDLIEWQEQKYCAENCYRLQMNLYETFERQKFEAASKYDQLEKKCASLKACLDKLYSYGPLQPSFWDFVAVTQIYDYLVSGECTELEGPNGAYIRYTNDVFYGNVCSKLEQVNETKNCNQRTLLISLKKCRETLSHMDSISVYETNTKIMAEFHDIESLTQQIPAPWGGGRTQEDWARIRKALLEGHQNNVTEILKAAHALVWDQKVNYINIHILSELQDADSYFMTYIQDPSLMGFDYIAEICEVEKFIHKFQYQIEQATLRGDKEAVRALRDKCRVILLITRESIKNAVNIHKKYCSASETLTLIDRFATI